MKYHPFHINIQKHYFCYLLYHLDIYQTGLRMYMTNLSHFLDETGNITKQMPKAARELAIFFSLIVDVTTMNKPSTLTSTDIRCCEDGCYGLVKTSLRIKTNEINWFCPVCENEGVISGWQMTKWDNSGGKK